MDSRHMCSSLLLLLLLASFSCRLGPVNAKVLVVVTPEQGLISTNLPLEPLISGLEAAEVTLNQLQEMGEKEGLAFEVERLIRTLLRGGRWRMAQVIMK